MTQLHNLLVDFNDMKCHWYLVNVTRIYCRCKARNGWTWHFNFLL